MNEKMKILIVNANFYEHLSALLQKGAMQALEAAQATVDIAYVPGALEIPAVISYADTAYDGFVALGCVIRGETTHYEIVSEQSAAGLQELSITKKLAIGNGILTVEDEKQALRRADPAQLDKGGEAAKACLALIELRKKYAH